MADAAKSARTAFSDIKSGSSEMSGHVGGNMFATRHAVMAVSEAFGVQMPRAITALIAHVGPLGAALEAAFPFAAIGLGIVLLIEHMEALKAAGIKLTEDQVNFGTAAQNAFNMLDQKILQAEIRADELRNNHLGALHKQLELIDRQSMDELVQTFGAIAKAADVVFADIKSHWYTFGQGSEGAKRSLADFQTQYKAILGKGDDKGASDMLHAKVERETKILAAQNQARQALAAQSGKAGTDVDDQVKYAQAVNTLKAMGARWDSDAVKAQQTLVSTLQEQVTAEQKVSELKRLDQGNAKQVVSNEGAEKAAEAARAAAEHQQRMGELRVAAEREQAGVLQTLHQASIAERLVGDIHLADEEYAVQLKGNQQLIAALDKGGKDYTNQLKALNEKAEELTAQHGNTIAGLQGKAQEEQYRKDLQDLEQSEREKIDATQQGSAERIAAISAALREEQARQLENTSFYRDLQTQLVEEARRSADEKAKLLAEAGKEEAANTERIGELALSAEKEQTALRDSARRVSLQRQLAEEVQFANEDFALKQAAIAHEVAALDKGGKDYENKLRELQDKQRQLVQQHENEITAIKDKAEMERNTKILAADTQFQDAIAAGLTQTIMGHKTFASMMNSLGNEVVSGLLQNALKSIMANDMTKESDAAAAARKAFLAGEAMASGPAGLILGAVMGAAAFTAVMAFQSGTDSVPGFGKGDTVPAMLEPGEGVVPGGVMDGLRNMVRTGTMGSSGGGNHYHAHVSPTYHLQALDTDGMQKVLDKHGDTLQKHVENTLRKMNR